MDSCFWINVIDDDEILVRTDNIGVVGWDCEINTQTAGINRRGFSRRFLLRHGPLGVAGLLAGHRTLMLGGIFGRLGEWTLTVSGVAFSTLKNSRLTIV